MADGPVVGARLLVRVHDGAVHVDPEHNEARVVAKQAALHGELGG